MPVLGKPCASWWAVKEAGWSFRVSLGFAHLCDMTCKAGCILCCAHAAFATPMALELHLLRLSRLLVGHLLFSAACQMCRATYLMTPVSSLLRCHATLLALPAVDVQQAAMERPSRMLTMYVNRCNAKWAEAATWDVPHIHNVARFYTEAAGGTANVFR